MCCAFGVLLDVARMHPPFRATFSSTLFKLNRGSFTPEAVHFYKVLHIIVSVIVKQGGAEANASATESGELKTGDASQTSTHRPEHESKSTSITAAAAATMDDDFVTKTAKHRKKHVTPATSDDPPLPPAAGAKAGIDGKPPAGVSSGAPAAGDGISLRPRTMFAMKGRGRTESEGSAYRPQWSKDGEGFVTASAATNGSGAASAGAPKDSASAVHYDPQGAADASRRKGKGAYFVIYLVMQIFFLFLSFYWAGSYWILVVVVAAWK